MEVIAKLNYLRVAPRKVRLVADLIRGKSVEEAQTILNFIVKKPTMPLLKLLKQAVANAQNNFQLDSSNLYISKITVDEGPKLKRWRARARGQTYEIQKKTSHITIVLDEKVKTKKKIKKVKEIKREIAKEPKAKITKTEKPKPKPEGKEDKPSSSPFAKAREIEITKPKIESRRDKSLLRLASLGKVGIKRIFRRKAF